MSAGPLTPASRSTCRRSALATTSSSPVPTRQSAVWYSGLPDMMWGENGQVNGNGQSMFMSDAFFNPLTNQWSKPTAWSVSALIEHHFTPQFYLDLEGSVGQLKWSNQGGGCNFYGFGCGAAQFVSGRSFADAQRPGWSAPTSAGTRSTTSTSTSS